MSHQAEKKGHRTRLRQRFLVDPQALPPVQLLELLLTYAIPRRDVAPLAQSLLDRFGSFDRVLAAPYAELLSVSGIGEQAAIFIKAMAQLKMTIQGSHKNATSLDISDQIAIQSNTTENSQMTDEESSPDSGDASSSNMEPDLQLEFLHMPEPTEPSMRAFVNDEIANALTFIPQAGQFSDFETFKTHLRDQLPYNSESTRQRRANHLLGRFFPANDLWVPLTYFATICGSPRHLKPVLFYHILKAEPLAVKVAEELIWPALPVGSIDRESVREFILRYLPDISVSSQKNVLRSLFNTYDLLDIGKATENRLNFHVQTSTLQAFLYLLTAEFSQPGIYTFEALDESPLRRWLLWDREWMRRQLYNLRDFGLVAKISEIDTLRQFTLQFDQVAALKHYFDHPERDALILRET